MERSEADGEARHRARGVEALPEDREHDHRQIRAGGDGEGQADEEGDVDSAAA